MIVGTDHEVLRVYDINTSQCFVSAISSQQHTSSVTCVKYGLTAKMYASGSTDGSIKLWDVVSGRCVNTFSQAHDGAEVCSVTFSKNGKVSILLISIVFSMFTIPTTHFSIFFHLAKIRS